MIVTGSGIVAEEVGNGLGGQNGIEEEMFTSDAESALEVERGLSRGNLTTNKHENFASLGRTGAEERDKTILVYVL